MLQRRKEKWGFVFEFCIQAPGVLDTSFPEALTPPLQVVPSLVLPPLASFFSVPLLRLWVFQIDSDITSEASLLAWFACIPFCISHEPFHRLRKELKKRKEKEDTTKTSSLSFSMQTIRCAVCIRYTPPLLIH
jgi:hypothetical protein